MPSSSRAKRQPRPYNEGDWFAVPLSSDDFAVGRVARHDRGHGVLGYFFGKRYASPPSARELTDLHSRDAVDIRECSDLGLRDLSWPVIGQLGTWTRSAWPMPIRGRAETPTRCRRIVHLRDTLGKPTAEETVSLEEAMSFHRDRTSGFLAVQNALSFLLDTDAHFDEGQATAPGDDSNPDRGSEDLTNEEAVSRQRPVTGLWLRIPLSEDISAYALGAGDDGRGRLLLYLFGPQYHAEEMRKQRPDMLYITYIDTVNVDAKPLSAGEWQVLEPYVHWVPEHWPIPHRGRIDQADRATRVAYAAGDLSEPANVEPVSFLEGISLRRDKLWTSRDLERQLQRRLVDSAGRRAAALGSDQAHPSMIRKRQPVGPRNPNRERYAKAAEAYLDYF
ncbi:MAG: Imm26 family immunity protein [Chloroflexota bacterium]